MKSPSDNCAHDRVLRLSVEGRDHWLCNLCGEPFIPRALVHYKIKHLTQTLQELMEQGLVRHEQAERMWREESISE